MGAGKAEQERLAAEAERERLVAEVGCVETSLNASTDGPGLSSWQLERGEQAEARHSGIPSMLKQLRLRAEKVETMLDEVLASSPTRSPPNPTQLLSDARTAGLATGEAPNQLAAGVQLERSPELDVAALESTPGSVSRSRERADFIRNSTPGGRWAEKGLAADCGVVMFNHKHVSVHASDLGSPSDRPTVGSQWTCISTAGASSHAHFAVAMASDRQLSHSERSCIERSIVHIYQPGDRISVKDVLVTADSSSADERSALMDAPERDFADDFGPENVVGGRRSYQVLTDSGWVNIVSRSGKVLFVLDVEADEEATEQDSTVTAWGESSTANDHTLEGESADRSKDQLKRRSCLCVSSLRSRPPQSR